MNMPPTEVRAAPVPVASTRGRLFTKYALLINALVGVLLLLSGALSLSFSYRESREHIVALQSEQARGAAARIAQYFEGIEQQLGWTALSGMNEGADPLELRRIDFLKLLRQVPAITEVAWLDPQGREQLRISRLAMDTLREGSDRAGEPLFREALAGRVWRSPVSFRKQTEPYITIARRAGPGGGVTAVDVNLKFVWDVVERIQTGPGGLAYVVDPKGALIAHPDISLVLKQTDLRALPQVAAALARGARPGPGADLAAPPTDSAAAAAHGTDAALDLSGRPVLSANAPLDTLGWTVFVEAPRSQAYAPLYASLQRLGLLLAAGLAISVVASAYLARTLVRPIRALQDGAARVAAGQLDQRIEVHTRDELATLAGEFNHMASELKASYAGLERKVDERTAELSESLAYQTAISQVLRVISESPTDTSPVFEKILDSCQHLFATQRLGIFLVRDDGQLHVGALRGPTVQIMTAALPKPLDQTATGLAIRQRRTVHIPNTSGSSELPPTLRETAARIGDYSAVFAPMLWENLAIGSIMLMRQPPSPFTDKEMALLRTFADQAVIAIQNSRLFEQLEAKTGQLEIASRHKSEFLANMSHELRTPLNAIIGFSEVLAERLFGEVNAKQLEYLNDIHASGEHLLALINDILDLAKIEAGRMELELSRFDVPQLLDSALALVRERATQHGLALDLNIASDVGEWQADPRKIKQVVINLLSNAVKFTPAGGQVSVRAQRARRDGSFWLELEVADTGVGIAPDQQQAVFEEFRQASGHYLRKAEGTGLGLSLVKRLVDLHGGTVALASAPGCGSRFTVALPERRVQPS